MSGRMAAGDHFRAHGRRRVELGAMLRDKTGSLAQGVRIRDLGLGGACLEISEAVNPGGLALESTVTIEVTAPTLWDPLTLRGKIAWLRRGVPGRPTRAGVRFEHRDASALYALFQLLGAHAYD
jgi:hypothetical protein